MRQHTTLVTTLGILSGLLYALWLLGYYLNRAAYTGLDVSALQAKGQPHYVFFVMGDVLTGLVTLLLAWLLLRINKPFAQRGALYLCCGGLVVFAIMTATACLLPSCIASSNACLTQATNVFDWHDVASGVAAFGQFVGLVGLLGLLKKQASTGVFWSVAGLVAAWSLSSLLFVETSFAYPSVMLLTQHTWLLLSSVCLAVMPLATIQKGVKSEGSATKA